MELSLYNILKEKSNDVRRNCLRMENIFRSFNKKKIPGYILFTGREVSQDNSSFKVECLGAPGWLSQASM